jgi:hypothetical protein
MVQGMHRLNKVYIFNDLTNYVREKFSFVTKEDKIVDEAKYHLMAAERYILSDFTPETVARHDTPLPPHRNYLRGN